MLQCDTVKQMLSNFIEGAVEPDIRTEIKTHLEVCSNCNHVFMQIKSITQQLHSIASIKTSPNFDQKLRAQIINAGSTDKPVVTVRNLSYGLSGLAVIAGAYFISTAEILRFDSPADSGQPDQTITNIQSVKSATGVNQPISNTGEILAADTLKSSPSNLEDRDLQLIDNR